MLEGDWQKLNTAFLTGGSEPFGLLSDAWPLALDGRMVACDGSFPADRREPVMLTVPGTGAAGVVSTLLAGLVPDTAATAAEAVIRTTLGSCQSPKEHPLARICAVLAESVTFDWLEAHREKTRAQAQNETAGQDEITVVSESCHLTDSLRAALNDLRARVTQEGRDSEASLFEVSLCACCLTRGTEAGQYILDIFCAGDYRILLWDGDGLSLIPMGKSHPLSPEGDAAMPCRRVRFERHCPFGILLLSGNLCGLHDRGKAGRKRSLRDRLHLEQRLLKVMQDAVTHDEIAMRAVRMLTDPTAEQERASGGLLLPPVNGGTETGAPADFNAVCRDRITRLEELLWLFPDKETDTAPAVTSCTDAERAYVRELLRRDPQLADSVTDRLTARIHALLDGSVSDTPALGDIPFEGCDPLRRLTRADVQSVYQRYDSENDPDRARIDKDRTVIRSVLSEHWMTLRPVLCVPDNPAGEPVDATAEGKAAARADACALLSRRIALQQAAIEHLMPLTDALATADDWMQRTERQFSAVPPPEGGFSLSSRVTEMSRIHRELADRLDEAHDRMNSLFTAYTYERDCLFRHDTEPTDGQGARLHTAYTAIMHGKLPASAWRWCLDAVSACPETRAFADMLRALPVISADIAASERVIAARDCRRRCVRELSEQADRMFDCLRAAVFRDTAWGDDIGTLVDDNIRRDYQAVIRKYLEDTRLAARRREVYASCLAAACRFGDMQD